MFKKFMCVALSIMMVLCTVSTVGFAADYTQGDLTASHVTFTDDGTATISIKNVASEGEPQTAVFWLGEYVDGVLVESDFAQVSLEAGADEGVDVTLSVDRDDNSVLKAYIWEDVVGGRAIAPVATYPSSSTEIKYALMNGEAWADFKADKFEYNIELDRTVFTMPEFDFYAADNSTAIVEPDEYVLGANYVVVSAPNGDMIVYTLNISYKAPQFKNFSSPLLLESNIREVYSFKITGANYPEMLETYGRTAIEGTNAWNGYPTYNEAAGTINNPGDISGYAAKLGHEQGELFTFKSPKGPNNNTQWYYGGVGTYDGTGGNYFLTFDIEAPGTMYLALQEGKTEAYYKNFVKEGYTVHPSDSSIYMKHYMAGETVKVPAMGWDTTWGDGTSGRKFMNSTYFMFGYDDPTAMPEPFDETDTKLKSFTYTIDGDTKTVDGFDAAVAGGNFTVDVPTGTETVKVAAERNEGYSKIDISATELTLVEGSATATVTVTAFNGDVATYTVTFNEIPAQPDDASLKSLTYKVGDADATSIDLDTGVNNRFAVTVPALTAADTIAVSAKASVGEDATVTVTDITEWTDYKATATVEVVAIDGVTTVTYYIDFTVEKHISEQMNKIYNLTAARETVKSTDNAYQNEDEATKSISYIVIGENLKKGDLKFYNNTKAYAAISDDMVGASYIRPFRNHSSFQTVVASGPVTRTVEGSDPKTSDYFNGGKTDFSTGYGFRTNQSLTRPWYAGAYSAANGEPGWIEFYVSSDCTVVIGDNAGLGYPNLDKTLWSTSDGSTNKIDGTSYYRTYHAGDLVQIPNYGIGGKLADETKVTYNYTDTNGEPQVYETTVANDYFVWDEISIAVKWAATYSTDNTISSVKVGGKDVDLAGMANNTVTVIADAAEGEVSLEIAATDAKATVNAPATVTIGNTATIVVTAENGDVATYYVKVEPKDVKNADLASLSYKIADGEWTAVGGFNANTLAYTVAEVAYVSGGTSVEIKGDALSDGSSVSGTLTGTLTDAEDVTLTITVTSEDGTVTKSYTVTFAMAEKVFEVVVDATDEYKALFNDGKYAGQHVITTSAAPTYKSGTQGIVSWDANGLAKNRKYTITVDGAAYADGDKTVFLYSEAVAIKAEKEAEGSTVALTASGYDYTDSKFTTLFSSSFNTSGHHFGPIGSAFRNADFQIMTHRAIAPGRVDNEAAAFKDTAATKEWVMTDSNYLFTVTPNSKATVYVAMAQADASKHSQYIADGWTFIDSSTVVTQAMLDSLPDDAIIDGFEGITNGRGWYMAEPSYIIEEAPYSLIKIQYDGGSNTLAQPYPYVWYKTVEEGETLKVPTVGKQAFASDQQPLKAFVIEGDHVAWAPPAPPVGADATLKTLKVAGQDIALAAGQYAYSVSLPYGITNVMVEAEANDSEAQVGGTGEIAVVDGGKITVVVTAADGQTVQSYEITVSISDIPFTNLAGDDTYASKAENVHKVVAADDSEYGLRAETIGSDYAAEAEAKAAYDTLISNFNAKFGKDAHLGTNLYNSYPKYVSVAGTTAGTYTYKIDNPTELIKGDNPIMNGDSWVFKTTKGVTFANNPIQAGDDLKVFGDSEEWIKFDIDAPGTMYVIDVLKVGYDHEGWELQDWTYRNNPVYAKHFEAGETVVVPAMNIEWSVLEGKMNAGKRIPNTPGFVFTFDNLSDATVEEITYTVDGTEYTTLVDGDEISIEALPNSQKVVITGAKTTLAATTIADLEITLTNGTGTGTLVATAPDGVTTKEYTVTVTSIEAYKIFDLVSYIGGNVKTANGGYMTEDEVNAKINYYAIGENMGKSTFRNFEVRAGEYFTPSADMLGASYIRTPRYYGATAKTITAKAGTEITKRVYNADGTYQDTVATKFGSGAGANQIRVFNLPEQSFYSGTKGWISFKVSSDCTVVLADFTDDITTNKYPNAVAEGWQVSDGKTNFAGLETSLYKEFKAGDTVKLPNYGLEGDIANTNKVEFLYTDADGNSQVYTTDVAHTVFSWHGVYVAVKWDNGISYDATLKTLKYGDQDITFEADKYDYEVELPYGSEIPAVTYEVNDANATAQATTEGNVTTIVVTAQNGAVLTYKVTFTIAKNNDATLKSAKIGDEDVVFDANNSATVELEAGSAIPEVVVETNDANAVAVATTEGNVTTIVVTAENGTTATYVINFTFKADASIALSEVVVNGLAAVLKTVDGETFYYAEVASDVTQATVEAIAEDENSAVTYAPSATVELEAGEYTVVTVTVTAQETADYIVKILRKVDTVIEDGTEDGGDL